MVVTQIEVQVEEIGHADGVVHLSPSLGLFVGDDFSHVLDDKSPAFDVLQNFDAPTTTVRGSDIKTRIFKYWFDFEQSVSRIWAS